MKGELSSDEIKNIVEELEINQPILAYKVVGSRVELRLLGGATAVYVQPGAKDLTQQLTALNVKELRFLATKFMLPKRGSMNKVQLIQALSNQEPTALDAALSKFSS